MGYTVYVQSPPHRPDDMAPRRPPTAPHVPVSNVLGVFGLSVRTRERDLEDEFGKYGDVEKVIIVYDQRVRRVTSHPNPRRTAREVSGSLQCAKTNTPRMPSNI